MLENREYCKRIADELENIAAGKAVNEDGEEMGLYDWVNDALDFEYPPGCCPGYIRASCAACELLLW